MQETQVQSLGQEDPWRKKWQPTPVILPGKSWGQKSLVGYSPWGLKELDMTERLSTHTESKKKKKKQNKWNISLSYHQNAHPESKLIQRAQKCLLGSMSNWWLFGVGCRDQDTTEQFYTKQGWRLGFSTLGNTCSYGIFYWDVFISSRWQEWQPLLF